MGSINPPPQVDDDILAQFDQNKHPGPSAEYFFLDLGNLFSSAWNIKVVEAATSSFIETHPSYPPDVVAQAMKSYIGHIHSNHNRHTQNPSKFRNSQARARRNKRHGAVSGISFLVT